MKVPRLLFVSDAKYVENLGSFSTSGLNSNSPMETRYYEGCGREGPIRCIFLGEFHPVAGPKVSCQVSNCTESSKRCRVVFYLEIVTCDDLIS